MSKIVSSSLEKGFFLGGPKTFGRRFGAVSFRAIILQFLSGALGLLGKKDLLNRRDH